MPKVHPLRDRGTWGNVARKNPPVEAESGFSTPVLNLADCIAVLEHTLRRLKQQQRIDLVTTIATVIGSGVCFSARELFELRGLSGELRQAFDDARIHNARVLGKRLRQLSRGADGTSALERVGLDHNAALWVCRL